MAVPKFLTSGLELEMVRTKTSAFDLIDTNTFGSRTDSSIRGKRAEPTNGIELVTPIIEVAVDAAGNDVRLDTSALRKAIHALSDCAAAVNSSCGVHVHAGLPNGESTLWNPQRLPNTPGGPASEWKPQQVRTMLAIGLGLEHKLFSVVPKSRHGNKQCRRISELYPDDAAAAYYPVNGLVPKKYDNPQRYCWLNLIETRRPSDPAEKRVGYARSTALGTIENRMLGETSRADYILAWSELWLTIAAAVASFTPEVAIIKCCHTRWLDSHFLQLAAFRARHDVEDLPTNQSALPADQHSSET